MKESLELKVTGHIRIYEEGNPSNVLLDMPNVIVNMVKSLFARLMASSIEPEFGIWGLALGAGDPLWAPETQPIETSLQTAIISPVLRKRLSAVRFVDPDLNPVAGFTNQVDFQTIVNATTDNVNQAIREMGLIGGGTNTVDPATNMLTAPFWDPQLADPNSVTLINYKTLPPLILPPGVNLIFSWVLSF